MSGHNTLPDGQGRRNGGTVYRSGMVNNAGAPPDPTGLPPQAGIGDGRAGTHRRLTARGFGAFIEEISGNGTALAGWAWSNHRQHTAVALLVFTIGVAPIALLPASSSTYAGIANLTPTIHTYTIALIAALVVAALHEPARSRAALLLWAPLVLWLAVLTPAAWGASARTLSGVLQLCLGAGAFIVGAAWEARDRRVGVLSWLFAAVAWIQLLACALAAIGLPLRTITGAQALDIKGRATGLTAHPGELSKLLFLCAVCILLLPQRNGWERWVVWSALGAVFGGVFLSESRTVLVAVIALVGLSVALELVGGRWQRRHLVIVGLTAGLGAASLPWLIARFAADPAGGARQGMLGVALRAIGDHPWTGVGVNGYVAVVGETDSLTRTGVPVHTIFLLSAAELGIIGALALWLPLAVVAVRAVRHLWRSRGADPAARILVSAMPGILLIGATGWGLMQGPYLLLLLLVTGYVGARVGASKRGGDGRG